MEYYFLLTLKDKYMLGGFAYVSLPATSTPVFIEINTNHRTFSVKFFRRVMLHEQLGVLCLRFECLYPYQMNSNADCNTKQD
jgi:hypothetical protein